MGAACCRAPSGKELSSPDSEVIIVWSYRTVQDLGNTMNSMNEYDKLAKDYGDYVRARVPGVKTHTYCATPENPLLVNDVQWFNSIASFRAHMFITDITGMTKLLKFRNGMDIKYNFRGYVFGAWEQTSFVGTSLPAMFEKMFPDHPAWYEFREQAAGFIRNTPASSKKPPIMIMSEWMAQDGASEEIVEMWREVADEVRNNVKVIGMWLSRECLRYPLRDKDKERNPNKLVAISAFEDLETFQSVFSLLTSKVSYVKERMAAPLIAEIWAEGDTSAVLAGMNSFDGSGMYTTFKMEGRGWSQHDTGCQPHPECTVPIEGELRETCQRLYGV